MPAKGFAQILRVFALVLMLGLTPSPATAAPEVETAIGARHGAGASASFRAAFEVLQDAVRFGDAATVASLVSYPLTVELEDERVVLHREADLIARYDDIFPPGLAAVVTGQDYADLALTEDGVFFDEDRLRLQAVCTDRTCAAVYWLIRAIDPDS